MVRVGINGFGRIGRQVLKAILERYPDSLEVVAVNDLGDVHTNAHLFKYDTNYGRFDGTVDYHEGGFIINGKEVKSLSFRDPAQLPWGDLGVELVIESTGLFTTGPKAGVHIEGGAKKVIISAPGKEVDATFVLGVNHTAYDPKQHHIVSNASCTTNCLAPVAKVLHDTFGIEHGLMTTIHSVTMSQRILDGSHKDIRRARACALSMIPTTTGAARAVTKVIPALTGRLDGMSIRVPTPNVSVVDFTCELGKATDTAGMLATLKAASGENMGFTEEPLVSVDFLGDTHGGVVDAKASQVLDGTLCKVLAWYDNEAGFTNQLVRLIKMVAAQ